MNNTESDKRESGIPVVRHLEEGTHFCLFYQTEKELLKILAPYFRAGLLNNEFCVWVTCAPLKPSEAKKAMKRVMPDFKKYAANGQIEIIPSVSWPAASGKAISAKIDRSVLRGFTGLRFACCAYPGKDNRKFSIAADAEIIAGHNAVAAYSYPREGFDALSLMEVVKKHHFALLCNAGKWEVLKSSEAHMVKDALKRSRERLHSIFNNMSEGYAYHRIVVDDRGKPCDYIFLEANRAFEKLTRFKARDIIGKRATEVLPGIEKDPADWIGKYGKVALSGKPARFEGYSEGLKKWFSVSAFSPHKGYFAVTFIDITHSKESQEELDAANEELSSANEELSAANEELSSANEELSASNEELRVETENRQRAEEHVRGAAERLRIVADFTYDWEYWRGANNRFLYVSPSCERVTGYTRDDFIRDPGLYLRIIHPQDRERLAAHMREDQASAKVYEIEFRIIRRDGSERWMGHTCQAVRDENGKFMGRRASNRDITESKRAEEALRNSKQRLNRAQEIAHLGSWELEVATNRLTWSDETYRIFGLKPQEFKATYGAFLKAVHPDDRKSVDEAYSGSLRKGEDSYEIEHRVVRKSDGKIRIVHEKCEHIRDASGRVIRSIGMVHDVTERNKAEEKISHLASFPQVNPNPILEIDSRGKIIFANSAVIKTLENLKAPRNMKLFFPEDFPRILKYLRSGKKKVFGREVRIKESVFIEALSVIPELKVVRIYARDITSLMRTEKELKKTSDYLERLIGYANAPIIVWDKTRQITRFNRAFEHLTGYKASEVIGKNISVLIPKAERKRTLEQMRQAARGKRWESVEIPILCKNKDIRIVLWNSANIYQEEERTLLATIAQGQDITGRKHAENTLKQSEERYRSIVATALDAFWQVDLQGRFLDFNDSACRMLGYSRDELLKMRISDIEATEDKEAVKRHLGNMMKAGGDRFESKHRRKDGTFIDVEVSTSFIREASGEHIYVFVHDITARKRSEGLLKKAHDELESRVAERTSQLMELNKELNNEISRRIQIENQIRSRNIVLKLLSTCSSRKACADALVRLISRWTKCRCVGIRLLNEEGKIPYESYTGFSREFWEYENWLSLKHDECACTRVMRGMPEPVDIALLSEQGSFYLNKAGKFVKELSCDDKAKFRGVCVKSGFNSVAVIPLRNKESIVGAIHLADEAEDKVGLETIEFIESLTGIIADGIHKFNLEDKIRSDHALLDAFFQHSINPFVFLDKDFNFIRVNEAYAEACKRKTSEFFGHNHFELYPHKENEEIFRSVVRTKRPYQAYAKLFVFPDHPEWGATYWDWTLVPILDEKGEVFLLVFSLNDVTERKRQDEKLVSAHRELDQARRLSDIGTLAATVAHELRNPLAAMRMAAFNIKRKAQNPLLDKHLENIETKVSESDQIINNLLFYSRIKAPHYETIDIHAILEEVIGQARRMYRQHKVSIGTDFKLLKGAKVEADPLQLKEAFFNIMNNAYDALVDNPSGHIQINAKAMDDDNILMVEIKDNGAGIDKEHLGKLSEPFFTTKAKGTGLGLTVCQQVVKLHGGRISFESEKGKGTTVYVTIPLRREKIG